MTHLILLILVGLLLAATTLFAVPTRRRRIAANEAGRHDGCITRKAEEAVTTRHLLAKVGTVEETDAGICDLADRPLGVFTDEAEAIGDLIDIQLPSAMQTMLCVASGAITAGADVYTTAGGKVTATPVVGCYHAGRALTTSTTDGDLIEVDPVKFGEAFVLRQRVTLAGGSASEAHTVTGLTTAMVVHATIVSNGSNDNASLLEALVAADTVTFLFNENPGDGLVVALTVEPATVAAVDLGA